MQDFFLLNLPIPCLSCEKLQQESHFWKYLQHYTELGASRIYFTGSNITTVKWMSLQSPSIEAELWNTEYNEKLICHKKNNSFKNKDVNRITATWPHGNGWRCRLLQLYFLSYLYQIWLLHHLTISALVQVFVMSLSTTQLILNAKHMLFFSNTFHPVMNFVKLLLSFKDLFPHF